MEETPYCFPEWLHQFMFPPAVHKGFLSSTSLWHLLSLVVLIIAILIHVSWYLTVILICIALMINDVKHLFMYLLAICMASFGKMDIQAHWSFLNKFFFFFLLLGCISSLYILNIDSYVINGFQTFSPILYVVSSFCQLFLSLCRSILVWSSLTCLFLSLLLVLLVSHPPNCCHNRCQGTFPIYFILQVL